MRFLGVDATVDVRWSVKLVHVFRSLTELTVFCKESWGREMNTSNLEKLKGSSEELVCVRACVFSSGCCGFLDVGCGVGTTWTDGNWCTLKEAKNLQLSNSHLLIFRFKEIPHDREINGFLLKKKQATVLDLLMIPLSLEITIHPFKMQLKMNVTSS